MVKGASIMDFSYENQGTNTYLVYEIKKEDELDTLIFGMLTNNKIPGLARTMFVQTNTEKYMKYDITEKISVKRFLNGTVSKKKLVKVFEAIVNDLLIAEEYMIDANSVVLNLDYIFIDISRFEIELICLPIQKKGSEVNDLNSFFKNIMFDTQFNQSENCEYIVKIINFLNSSLEISLNAFRTLLDEIKSNACDMNKNISNINEAKSQHIQNTMDKLTLQSSLDVTPALKSVTIQSGESSVNCAKRVGKRSKNTLFTASGKMKPARLLNQKAEEVIPKAVLDETVVLEKDNMGLDEVIPYLIRTKNHEKIMLNKPLFRIGKDQTYADHCITDNRAISRRHANMVIRRGAYYIIDTNSTNHTYVNGKITQSNEEVAITHGDIIRLADEDFEFRLY